MKVWCVFAVIQYEGEQLMAIYSTKEKAEARAEALEADRNHSIVDEYQIDEFTVDGD